jgi:Raf kinase inhibitor-like YbhB/YbcL family protein
MSENRPLQVASRSFKNEGPIPIIYTCEGENINPHLEILDTPEKTQSLALIVEDPDAPNGIFDHWICWNIPPNKPIEENTDPGMSGMNSFGKPGYGGPCPPTGTHRYYFKVFALDILLDLPEETGKDGLLEAINNHIIAKGEIMGTYKKVKK